MTDNTFYCIFTFSVKALLPADTSRAAPASKTERFPGCLLLLLSFAYKLKSYCSCKADYAKCAQKPTIPLF